MDNKSIPLIFDAHLDLSMNAMEWNRDLRWTVQEIRNSEAGLSDKKDRAKGTVSFPSLRDGNVGVVVGTMIARYARNAGKMPGASWNSPEQAWAQTQGQMTWYDAMEELGEVTGIIDIPSLEKQLERWQSEKGYHSLGLIKSLEGADSILSFKHLEKAYERGLRAIGPAHYGPGVYAQGTGAAGGIGKKGRGLLKEIERLNVILDVTHLCDESFWEAMDYFNGPVWSSHTNCRSLVPHHRQFSDDQLKELIAREAVIGVAFDTWMLVPGWIKGESTPESMDVNIKDVVDHIDHICQLTGDTLHVGIGSDLDGAYGKEQSPHDLDTISDLQKIPLILKERGYSPEDISNICANNWIRFLKRVWK